MSDQWFACLQGVSQLTFCFFWFQEKLLILCWNNFLGGLFFGHWSFSPIVSPSLGGCGDFFSFLLPPFHQYLVCLFFLLRLAVLDFYFPNLSQ